MSKPLDGVRIIELAGIGPGPYAGQLLADMGAEIIVINRPGPMGAVPNLSHRGKKTLTLDLRKPEGAAIVLDLVKSVDVLFEGLRPGVIERLGVGPEACHAVNPKLVYGRMTGWGQSGPWAKMAGHDINYISITGALAAMGPADTPPSPPLNLVGDYGGGSLFLVAGILAGLFQAQRTGKGEIVDAAIIDGTNSMMGILHMLSGLGRWSPQRGTNMLDGAWPFYRCYATKDGKFMAVGPLEPQFFAEMLRILEIDAQDYGPQRDVAKFPEQHAMLEAKFANKTRDDWAKIFDGTDACVTPVLTYEEAPDHPQNAARGGLRKQGAFVHPRPAPGFRDMETDPDFTLPGANTDAAEVFAELGYDAAKIESLKAAGVIS